MTARTGLAVSLVKHSCMDRAYQKSLLALEFNRASLVSCALDACKRNVMLHACCAHAWRQYSLEGQLEVLLK